jgi:hypothetical protein
VQRMLCLGIYHGLHQGYSLFCSLGIFKLRIYFVHMIFDVYFGYKSNNIMWRVLPWLVLGFMPANDIWCFW